MGLGLEGFGSYGLRKKSFAGPVNTRYHDMFTVSIGGWLIDG